MSPPPPPPATLVPILECLVKEFYFSGEAYGRLYEILVFLWFFLVGIFPSPLPAWGVGHVDAQEQFSEVSPVLEPERGGAGPD